MLCLRRPGDIKRGTSRVLREARTAWIGHAALAECEDLPLVLLEQSCAFRTALLETLDCEGRAYRIKLETPNLPGLRAGVRAGLGVISGIRDFAAAEGLPMPAPGTKPPLASIDTVLLQRATLSDAAADLVQLLEEATGTPA